MCVKVLKLINFEVDDGLLWSRPIQSKIYCFPVRVSAKYITDHWGLQCQKGYLARLNI